MLLLFVVHLPKCSRTPQRKFRIVGTTTAVQTFEKCMIKDSNITLKIPCCFQRKKGGESNYKSIRKQKWMKVCKNQSFANTFIQVLRLITLRLQLSRENCCNLEQKAAFWFGCLSVTLSGMWGGLTLKLMGKRKETMNHEHTLVFYSKTAVRDQTFLDVTLHVFINYPPRPFFSIRTRTSSLCAGLKNPFSPGCPFCSKYPNISICFLKPIHQLVFILQTVSYTVFVRRIPIEFLLLRFFSIASA